MKSSRRNRNTSAEDLNVAPLMNLFIAIVPLLLLSAVFVSVSTIDLTTPGRTEAPPPQQADDFVLALRVTQHNWWVDARGEDSIAILRGDVPALLEALEVLHAAHPQHKSVLIACQDGVAYDDVVRVLDVTAMAGLSDAALVGMVTGEMTSNTTRTGSEDTAPASGRRP